ncbi:MAG: hypothetical protein SOW55_06620 [Bacilli bacterium]|nr:hypothetical protein [Bacillales bacterium]MDY2575621.1 hypothetical protein [Bacilli bacterium]
MENSKSRVEKYRKHREEISQMDTYKFESPYSIPEEDEDDDVAMNEETLKTEHIKKSTLSISLDQLIKAHDEYTIMMSQEEINKKKKEEQKIKFRKIRNMAIVIGGILLAIALLITLILVLLNK